MDFWKAEYSGGKELGEGGGKKSNEASRAQAGYDIVLRGLPGAGLQTSESGSPLVPEWQPACAHLGARGRRDEA